MKWLIEFAKNMTIWNWLALVAFVFATISVLNALLSLKSRFRDWRGIQSRKAFEKRVKQLEKELARIKEYAAEPTRFYLYLLFRGTRLLVGVLAANAMFAIAFGITAFPFPFRQTGPEVILTMGGVLLLGVVISIVVELNNLIRVVANPKRFAVKLIAFITEGKAKGFELSDDGELMKFLKQVKGNALSNSPT